MKKLFNLHAIKTIFVMIHIIPAIVILFPNQSLSGDNPPGIENQLTLEKAYQIALMQNERIAASLDSLKQAEADIGIATSPLLPQIDLQAESVKQAEHPGFPENYNDIGISAYQSIFKGGKNWYERSSAKLTAESKKLGHFRLKQETLYAVAHRFYLVLLARKSIKISENQRLRALTQLDRANQLMELGMTNETAVLRAKVQTAVAEENLERAKNSYQIFMEQLSLELGMDEPPMSLVEPEELIFASNPSETYIDKAFKHRSDIQQVEFRVEASESTEKSEKADFIPDFFLEGNYTQSDTSKLFYGDKDHWEVALKASYPLYTGNRNSSELSKARALVAENKSILKRLKQEVRVSVRSIYYDIHTQQKVIKNILDQVAAASANYQQVTAQFEEGLSSSVDVVDAETSLNEAENQLAKAYYRFQLDQLRMRLATGTLGLELLNN